MFILLWQLRIVYTWWGSVPLNAQSASKKQCSTVLGIQWNLYFMDFTQHGQASWLTRQLITSMIWVLDCVTEVKPFLMDLYSRFQMHDEIMLYFQFESLNQGCLCLQFFLGIFLEYVELTDLFACDSWKWLAFQRCQLQKAVWDHWRWQLWYA